MRSTSLVGVDIKCLPNGDFRSNCASTFFIGVGVRGVAESIKFLLLDLVGVVNPPEGALKNGGGFGVDSGLA